GPLQEDVLALGEVYSLLSDVLSKVESNKVLQIGKILTNAVEGTVWTDSDHPTAKGGKTVFGKDQQSTQDLLALLKTKGNTLGTNTLNSIAGELVQSARNTALI